MTSARRSTASARASSHPPSRSAIALDRFYDLLLETGERRQFSFGPRGSFVGWWEAALAGRASRLPRGRVGGRRWRSPGWAHPVSPRRSVVDRPFGRSRRDAEHPSGRAPPVALAGDPAGDPRRMHGDGPRWRRRCRGTRRTARRRRALRAVPAQALVRRPMARVDGRPRADLRRAGLPCRSPRGPRRDGWRADERPGARRAPGGRRAGRSRAASTAW